MLVRALMLSKQELVTVGPEESLKTALDKINEKNFLSIPVIEGKKFVGIISKEKIYAEYFLTGEEKDKYLEGRKVKELMRCDIPALKPQDEIEKATNTLEIYGVPFVAVINDLDEFEGIITHHAIFREFTNILGVNRGKRLAVIAYDVHGQIAKLSDIISKLGGDIISFVIIDPKVKTDVKEIVVRMRAENFAQIVEAVKHAGFRVQ
jgi:acetoin utilization protein AcuB